MSHPQGRVRVIGQPLLRALLLILPSSWGLDNGLGLTPPLTYSVWNFFSIGANETHVLETASALESTGLKALGYDTIALDAGSIAFRDPVTDRLVASKHRFPSGLRALSDELHRRGFKFGGYTDLSGHTCGNGPNTGSLGRYELDANTFALDWQIDYLKVDFCGFRHGEHCADDPRCVPVEAAQQFEHWSALRDAVNKTGRPIYLSICPHAVASGAGTEVPKDAVIYAPPPEWTRAERHNLANSLLVEYDNAFDAWLLREESDGTPGAGLIYNIDAMLQATRLDYSAPGSWNDGDMLQVCNYGDGHTPGHGMSLNEYRVMYTVWSILASPLILGTDLQRLARGEHPECLALLLNADIVAVNQDPAALPARLVAQLPPFDSANATTVGIIAQVLARPLSRGRLAVLLLNRSGQPARLSVSWAQLGLSAADKVGVYDVVAQRDAGSATGAYTADVPSHDVSFVVLRPADSGHSLHGHGDLLRSV